MGIRKHLLGTLYKRCTPRIVISNHSAFNYYTKHYWVHNNFVNLVKKRPVSKPRCPLQNQGGRLIGSRSWYLDNLRLRTTGTPRLGCVVTNANKKHILSSASIVHTHKKSVIWEIKTRQILEIKSVIWEIKRDKFWKSKMHLRNQTRQTLKIKIVIGEIKRDKFKIKMTQ